MNKCPDEYQILQVYCIRFQKRAQRLKILVHSVRLVLWYCRVFKQSEYYVFKQSEYYTLTALGFGVNIILIIFLFMNNTIVGRI